MDEIGKKLENIFPLVIGLVITKIGEKVNICPINWQVVSTKYETPITVCIGLSHTSYSLDNIKATNQFTLAYPSKEQLEDTIYCGTVSGRSIDKLKSTSFKFNPSKHINPPHIRSAVINFECEVIQIVTLETFCIIIANVLAVETSSKRALDKIYALGRTNYGSIKEVSVDKVGR